MIDRPARLSVIIPTHRDTDAALRLLHLLAGIGGIDEVVLSASDTGSDLREREPALPMPLRWIAGPAGRGVQLNRGAAAAEGDVLWFLHADATPPGDGPSVIREALELGAIGGWCRFRFQGVHSRAARVLARMINWRSRHGTPYGDQGLWMTRTAFDGAGGFEPVPLFEEVALVRGARLQGRFVELPVEIGVSPRRWRENGWIRRTLENRALALLHAAGVPPNTLARWYR